MLWTNGSHGFALWIQRYTLVRVNVDRQAVRTCHDVDKAWVELPARIYSLKLPPLAGSAWFGLDSKGRLEYRNCLRHPSFCPFSLLIWNHASFLTYSSSRNCHFQARLVDMMHDTFKRWSIAIERRRDSQSFLLTLPETFLVRELMCILKPYPWWGFRQFPLEMLATTMSQYRPGKHK